jgi:hypothetical protein
MRQYAQLADERLAALGLYRPSAAGSDDCGGGGGGGGPKGGGLGGPVMSRLVYGEDSGGSGGGGADSSLHEAAGEGDEAALSAALAAGADVDGRDDSGCTALHFAADRGRVGALRLLLAAGAHVDARDDEGQTALHYAAVCGQREVRGGGGSRGAMVDAERLKTRPVSLRGPGENSCSGAGPERTRKPPLRCNWCRPRLSLSGLAQVFAALLEAGANPDIKDSDGQLPREVADWGA